MSNQRNIARALIVIGALGFSAPALADTVCLRKPPEAGGAQARPPAQVKAPSFNAIVLAQDAAGYIAKGFTVVACPSEKSQAQYRETICAAVEKGNSSLRAQLEGQIGEKPAKICAAARVAVTLAVTLPVRDKTGRSQVPPSQPSDEATPQN